MDNASIHHCQGISDMINGVGALLMYLPPYSPEYNPIEELFSKLKTTVKMYEKNGESNEMDTESIVYASLTHIIPEDCQDWISDKYVVKYTTKEKYVSTYICT